LKYDGLIDVDIFVREFELHIPDQQRFPSLDIALKEALARGWVDHKDAIYNL
jgi:hypothetical protein